MRSLQCAHAPTQVNPQYARMIDDRDIWAAALLLVKRYGDDASHGKPP